jgi:hypothetical protein
MEKSNLVDISVRSQPYTDFISLSRLINYRLLNVVP